MRRTVTIGSMRRSLRRLIRDAQESVDIGVAWARLRPEEKAIDVEVERVILAKAKAALAALEANQMDLYGRLTGDLADYARSVGAA